MDNDEEPNVWITVAKLVIGAIVIIGGTGFALWYFGEEQERSQTSEPASGANVPGWGIIGDSPLRKNR